MTNQIGHNNGPAFDAGLSWRKHVWTKARADLLPRLPIEVLRQRVKRAQELGLPYKTYASVRASTGRDVIGFLFSSNALRVLRAGQSIPADRTARLVALDNTHRHALSHVGPIISVGLDGWNTAPKPFATWPQMAADVGAIIRQHRLPRDGVLVIGETSDERLWAEAAKTAGFLGGDRYFTQQP